MPSDRLITYDPIGVLKPVAEDVWIVDGPLIQFGIGPIRAPFTTRMTIIRLPDSGLWLHSPIEADETLFSAVEKLGPVSFLIAPNPIHYWWIGDWKLRFPSAEVHAVESLKVRAKRPLPPFQVLTGQAQPSWRNAIDQLLVQDGWFSEAVFFHRDSRTLILADLIENFELSRVRSPLLRLFLRIGGVLDPDGKMPADMRFAFHRHRADLKRAVDQMIAWGPERIILAHGRWYDRDAVVELRRAFRFLF